MFPKHKQYFLRTVLNQMTYIYLNNPYMLIRRCLYLQLVRIHVRHDILRNITIRQKATYFFNNNNNNNQKKKKQPLISLLTPK